MFLGKATRFAALYPKELPFPFHITEITFFCLFSEYYFQMTPNYQRTDNKKYCVSQLEQSYIHVFRALPQDFTIEICWTLMKILSLSLSLSLPPVHLILSSKASSYLFEGGRGKIKWGSTSPLLCKFFFALFCIQ